MKGREGPSTDHILHDGAYSVSLIFEAEAGTPADQVGRNAAASFPLLAHHYDRVS